MHSPQSLSYPDNITDNSSSVIIQLHKQTCESEKGISSESVTEEVRHCGGGLGTAEGPQKAMDLRCYETHFEPLV